MQDAAKTDILQKDFIVTKITKPTLHQVLIPRIRLNDKLNRVFRHTLTVLAAPAGYGKTTAVISWLEECRFPVVWFSIDREDDDPVGFWRCFIRALECGLADQSLSLSGITVNKELIESNALARFLVAHLAGITEKVLIIFDDYHFIQNPILQNSMVYWIKYAPSNFHTVILSRKEMEPEFETLYIRGQVLKIDSRDLAFTADEISVFFNSQGFTLSEPELRKIQAETEGWAAGLVVTAIAMTEEKEYLSQNIHLPGMNRHIDKFLRDQIYSPAPEEIKTFLVRTCVADRFSVPLCIALTGFDNSEEILTHLLDTNSFIISLDQRNEWFRYHHLFSKFLKTMLKKEKPNIVSGLYTQAGQWFRQNGRVREAMEMFMRGRDYSCAFTIFWHLYNEMVFSGEYAVLLRWMEGIPEEYHHNDVVFCSARAWLLAMENRKQEAMEWAQKAKESFHREKDRIESKQYRDFLDVMVLLGQADLAIRNMDSLGAANYYAMACKIKPQTKILLGEANNGQPGMLRTFYGFYGRFKKVEEAYGSTRESMWSVIGVSAVYSEILIAECHYERNELEKCYEVLTRSLQKVYALNTNGALVPAFITLAKAKKAFGDIKGALGFISEAKGKLTTKSGDHWHYLLDLFMARLYMDMGDIKKAEALLDLNHVGVYDSISAVREYEYITYARYLFVINRYEEAAFLLERLDEFARQENRLSSRIEVLCMIALLYDRRKQLPQALMVLDKALKLGYEDGYIRTFIDEAQPLFLLLGEYLREKKDSADEEIVHYVRTLSSHAEKEAMHLRITGEGMPAEALTRKEYHVLQLICSGRSNEEIATELGISVRTVKYHNSNLFAKLGVKRRAEAISKAMSHWDGSI